MRDMTVLKLLALVAGLGLALALTPVLPPEAAWAQDDDDDDGGAGGNDDDDGPRARPSGQRTAPATRARPAAPVPPPAFAPGEIVALSLGEDDLGVLVGRGYRVLEERAVPALGVIARRLEIPAGTALEAARAEVRALPTGADADFNHYYRSEQAAEGPACTGPHCASLELIGWIEAPDPPPACAEDVVVGVVDTGINPDHLTFSTARLEVQRIAPEALEPSRAVHGTAVLALLVGDPASRSPGLLPDTRVIAVDAFHRAGGDERADVFTLVAALDYLAGQGVRVVNLSLAGPDNRVLERATAAILDRDIVVVAAVGNAGPAAPPAFPAAYPEVIGVTAVDRSGTVYRRAGRGPHVDLAAPGVEVWTAASVSGARPKTGTSFAAPFVTAAAAALRAADPALTREEVAAALTGAARDLGAPGRDDVYGHGLVQAARLCRPPA